MMRSLLLLLAVPFGAAAAQSAVHFSVTSANETAFRIVSTGRDSVQE